MQDDHIDDPPRRNFLLEFWTILVGGIVGVFPFLAGVATFLDPLARSQSSGAELVRIAPLEAIPADGVPRQFPVIKDRVDAWTFSPNERVGAVFLIRQPGSDEIEAFNVVCPHLGCAIGYKPDEQIFLCPCHTSSFELDGAIITPSPSPRGMDKFEKTEVKDGFVYVPFANFKTGRHEKVVK